MSSIHPRHSITHLFERTASSNLEVEIKMVDGHSGLRRGKPDFIGGVFPLKEKLKREKP